MTPREQILLARRAKKWTQAELAKAIDVHGYTISRFESGEQGMSNYVLWKLCNELELNYAELCKELKGRVILPNQVKFDIEAAMTGEMAEKICGMLRQKKVEDE